MKEIRGSLIRVKENDKTLVFEIQVDSPKIRGSLYIDRCAPIFNRLILEKGKATNGS